MNHTPIFVPEKNVFLFDAFGTLFKTADFQSELAKLIGEKTDALVTVWRQKQLQYSWLRNAMGQYQPFDIVTKEALDFSMQQHGISNPRIYDVLLPLYQHPILLPGVIDLFHALKNLDKRVGILSNGTPAMLQNGVEFTGIKDLVDFIISVDEIKIYKPRPEVYQMALRKIGVPTEQLLFFSSNQWDISGASVFGLDTCWINQ